MKQEWKPGSIYKMDLIKFKLCPVVNGKFWKIQRRRMIWSYVCKDLSGSSVENELETYTTGSQTQWELEESHGNDIRETWSDGGDSTKVSAMGLYRISDKGSKGQEGVKNTSNFKLEWLDNDPNSQEPKWKKEEALGWGRRQWEVAHVEAPGCHSGGNVKEETREIELFRRKVSQEISIWKLGAWLWLAMGIISTSKWGWGERD